MAEKRPIDVRDADPVVAHASDPEVLDVKALERDAVAGGRDAAALERDARVERPSADQAALDRMLAARDRAAAALDRREAALDRNRAKEYLQRTYRDELTGALQRTAGRDQLGREVDRMVRSGDPLVIAFLDVVNLKGVNDEQGHAVGDALLRAVGHALREGLRTYDVVVRYGGDEFVCALPQATIDDARRRFEQVGNLLRDLSPDAAVRIGLAELQPADSLEDVVRRADADLYDRTETLGAAQPAGPRLRVTRTRPRAG